MDGDGELVSFVRLESNKDIQQLITSKPWMRVHCQGLIPLPKSVRKSLWLSLTRQEPLRVS